MNNDELLDFAEESMQSPYVVKNSFFVKTDERWAKVKYDEILWVRAFENGSVVFLTGERSLMVNHRLWRIEEMLTDHPNFVRINRSEIVNLGVKDVLAKSKGSSNPHNLVKATIKALSEIRDAYTVAQTRGISLDRVFNG